LTLNLAGRAVESNRGGGDAGAVAEAISAAWERYVAGFEEITRRARRRFERRDWAGSQNDAAERLTLYRVHLDAAVADVRDILGDAVMERTRWALVKAEHARRTGARPDGELARTFFNSVTRRVFSTVGVDPAIEYLESAAPEPDAEARHALVAVLEAAGPDAELVRRILLSYQWSVPYAQLADDADLVARIIADRIGSAPEGITVEMLRPVFFRNKGAYLVGRLRRADTVRPLVLPLINAERGIVVDAVLMTENEASVVFGFSWSYFRVEVPHPRAMVDFLRSIMPYKRVDELYTAIGFSKHGKTELFRSLRRHLEEPDASFAFAEGDEGMVMAVFTLPASNVVFKIIKDSFGAPKNTTRAAVMEKYHFVFVRDRVGRLADAQEFEHLDFPRRCFPDELLSYLLHVSSATVRVEGERVVVRHLYTERRVVPLNLFLRDAEPEAARDAVIDYGMAIKDLAAADIFTGDMLLKNFGVTRNGRVICYDYDELVLLSECRFRRLPEPQTLEDEMSAEPWFHVGEHDIFPEEFRAFLVPPGRLREAFLAAHGDLLEVAFWQGVQQRVSGGEVVDVFPYRRSELLRRRDDSAPT
jgi:isocitrate dehydrogenase kinase/phosphatase